MRSMPTEIKKNRPDDQMTNCFLKLYTPTRVCEIIIRNWSAGQPVSRSALKSRMTSGTMDERRRETRSRNSRAQDNEGRRGELRQRRCRTRDTEGGEENSGSEGAGHRTMRGGMSGCHPDATTKKIAGERETSEQNQEKTGRRCP